MGWIHVAEERDQWQVLVNTVTYFSVPQNAASF
jgi:hypothetical protein